MVDVLERLPMIHYAIVMNQIHTLVVIKIMKITCATIALLLKMDWKTNNGLEIVMDLKLENNNSLV